MTSTSPKLKCHFFIKLGNYKYDNYHSDKGGNKKYYDNGFKAKYGGNGAFWGKGSYKNNDKWADWHKYYESH